MQSTAQDTKRLADFIAANPRTLVLTGAGVSAASGIPTYRDHAGRWQHSEPIKHQQFISDAGRRRRYWARSMRGWPNVRDAMPNVAHRVLCSLEQSEKIVGVITQNVDRLHQRAGSKMVIDLHGRLDQVRCLDCDRTLARQHMQHELEKCNPQTIAEITSRVLPDGDADVTDAIAASMVIPDCPNCGGVLKPDVVFFGDTVPRTWVDKCMAAVEGADALLVVGSSLQVFSGFRFCRHAARRGIPIAILNQGATRADSLASLKISGDCGGLLQSLLY